MYNEETSALHHRGERGSFRLPGRRGRCAAALAVLLATAACNPYPEVPPVTGGDRTADGQLDSTITPTMDTDIGAALIYAETYRETLVRKRSEQTTLRTAAGALVFGGAVATGAAALYGASTDLVLGLALGTATTYVGSQLYNPRSFNSIYNAGLESVACIEEATRHVYAASDGLREAQQALQGKVEVLQWRLGYLDTSGYSSAIDGARDSLGDFESARGTLTANKEDMQAIAEHPRDDLEKIEDDGNRTNALVVHDRVSAHLDRLDVYRNLEDRFSDTLDYHDKLLAAMKTLRGNAFDNLSDAEDALQEVRVYRRQESEFAATAVAKIRSIGRRINRMIDEAQPSLDAVLAAAQGISARGIEASDRVQEMAKQTQPAEAETAVDKPTPAAVREEVPTGVPAAAKTMREPLVAEEDEDAEDQALNAFLEAADAESLAELQGFVQTLDEHESAARQQANAAEAAIEALSAEPAGKGRKPADRPNLSEPESPAEAVKLAREGSRKVVKQTDALLTALQPGDDVGKAEQVLKDCNLSTSGIGGGPIKVKPSGPIELATGQTQSLLVSGGRQPYIPSWQGAKPDQISWSSMPRGANLTAIELTASGAVDRTYTLVISDSGGGDPVEIEVKSK